MNNQALVDGNKRLGWLAAAVFLEINDASVAKVDNDTVYDLVVDVAASDLGIDEIASRLEQMAERSA